MRSHENNSAIHSNLKVQDHFMSLWQRFTMRILRAMLEPANGNRRDVQLFHSQLSIDIQAPRLRITTPYRKYFFLFLQPKID